MAWASTEFDVYKLLLEHKSKIEQMVVGTHFYQTHPSFIDSFRDHPNVKFILNPDGVFHPKVYLFMFPTGTWECLIGSPNFTAGGFARNTEMAVLISGDDLGAEEALRDVTNTFGSYWSVAKTLTQAELEAYRAAWQRKQPLVKNLRGRFGSTDDENGHDGGRYPLGIEIVNLDWPSYFRRVKAEARHHPHLDSTEERLKVMRTMKTLFSGRRSLSDIDVGGWRRIGGFIKADGVNYLWFGSMRNGHFQQAINNKDGRLALALDEIPVEGPVVRDHYAKFIQQYKTLSKDEVWLATATRLLAMKRPDLFICFDGNNQAGLRTAFGFKGKIGYEEYWDSIIDRIKDAVWWNAPAPAPGTEEREVWDARAAFLDALYYDGKDMPPP